MIDKNSPQVSPTEARSFHELQATHLRALAEQLITNSLSARLLRQAEEHERLVREEMAEP